MPNKVPVDVSMIEAKGSIPQNVPQLYTDQGTVSASNTFSRQIITSVDQRNIL